MNCIFSFFQSSLTQKVSQQELDFNDTMIEKEQTINEKFDSLTEKVSQQELVFNDMMIEKEQTINEKFDEHEQKLQNIVSVNLHSFCTKFNSILIELGI